MKLFPKKISLPGKLKNDENIKFQQSIYIIYIKLRIFIVGEIYKLPTH